MKQPNLSKISISTRQMADGVKTLGNSMEVLVPSMQKLVRCLKQIKKSKIWK